MDNSSVTYRPDKLMNHTGPEIKGRPYYSSVHYNKDQKKTADRPDQTRLPYIPCSWASTVYYPALIAHKKKLGFRVKIELALFNEISLIITCI